MKDSNLSARPNYTHVSDDKLKVYMAGVLNKIHALVSLYVKLFLSQAYSLTAQFCYCVTINPQFNPFCFTLGLQMFKEYLVSQNVLLKQERLRSCYQDVRISENALMNYRIH
jgi:hypothetical protein